MELDTIGVDERPQVGDCSYESLGVIDLIGAMRVDRASVHTVYLLYCTTFSLSIYFFLM